MGTLYTITASPNEHFAERRTLLQLLTPAYSNGLSKAKPNPGTLLYLTYLVILTVAFLASLFIYHCLHHLLPPTRPRDNLRCHTSFLVIVPNSVKSLF